MVVMRETGQEGHHPQASAGPLDSAVVTDAAGGTDLPFSPRSPERPEKPGSPWFPLSP